MRSRPSVLAACLTFDAPEAALTWVERMQAQTRRPDEILVVDCHSPHPPDVEKLAALGPAPVRVVILPENVGPAGGHAAALSEFLRSEHDLVWSMDDDIDPAQQCLELMVTEMVAVDFGRVLAPNLVRAHDGSGYPGWGWHGALIPRDAVKAAGLPRSEFVWGLEEVDYFIDRLPLAGYPNRHVDAAGATIVDREGVGTPGWKHYYETRNMTWLYLYGRRHIPRSTRVRSLLWMIGTRTLRVVRDERDAVGKLLYIVRGVVDGLTGRLGRRVEPGASDRPWAPDRLRRSPSNAMSEGLAPDVRSG